ncbi:trypsin-like serine peptidase [Azohydromonas caseinilytica]|uniref:Trypsin-like serine protease n=1 Tax=Azohydromonas caseinilytica TaxID=2728836 RepID=A0A848F939_9BURK|nr:trypsin-like serine protease [Azohydromonas caseinilytica]NML14853.1 trypsin-like serine protease [Azohydromonas caseinilytica]
MNAASITAVAAASLAVFAAHTAQAQSVALTRGAQVQAAAEFSDAELLSAKSPMPKVRYLPASAFDYNAAAAEAQSRGVAVDKPGKRPVASAQGLMTRRQISAAALAAAQVDDEVRPEAVGTGGIHFTSTRTYPRAQDWTYPSSTVGKLFFKDAAGYSYICSGAMIRPGVVATAGHCVHSGRPGGWYNSFVFIPGYSRVGTTETRPFGTWSNWANVRTTAAWANGGGTVPNAGDWALIVFNRDANGKRIGDYTGFMGYQYPSMIGRHLTVLGYPANLDGGTQMHRVESMANNGGTNNGIWGSDMTGGSSGGPVVLNFRQDYVGLTTSTQDNGAVRLVSNVSWGYTSPTVQVQGGSQFDSSWGSMLSATCTAYSWAC